MSHLLQNNMLFISKLSILKTIQFYKLDVVKVGGFFKSVFDWQVKINVRKTVFFYEELQV